MSEWFENEDFWTEMYPYMFPEERLEAAEAEVEKILSLVEFSGTHVLDLCCGPGRHATILAERGFSVTGVDTTAFLLQKARARGKRAKIRRRVCSGRHASFCAAFLVRLGAQHVYVLWLFR